MDPENRLGRIGGLGPAAAVELQPGTVREEIELRQLDPALAAVSKAVVDPAIRFRVDAPFDAHGRQDRKAAARASRQARPN